MEPVEAAAEVTVGLVRTSELPDLAAGWLSSGWDSPGLRELAGHPHVDAWGVQVLWLQVLEELGVVAPVTVEQAWPVAPACELRCWRCGSLDDESLSRRLLLVGGAVLDFEPYVWQLYGMQLEWDAEPGWGRGREQLVEERRALLSAWAGAVLDGSQ